MEGIKQMDYYKPMTDAQCETFVHLTLAEQASKEQFDRLYHEQMKPLDLICKILEKRIEAYKLPNLEPSAIIFISLVAEGNPGRSILCLIETLEKSIIHKPELIDSTFMAMNVYPWGFYTAENFEKEFDNRREHPKGRFDFLIDGNQEVEVDGKTAIKKYAPQI